MRGGGGLGGWGRPGTVPNPPLTTILPETARRRKQDSQNLRPVLASGERGQGRCGPAIAPGEIWAAHPVQVFNREGPQNGPELFHHQGCHSLARSASPG